MVAKRAYPRRGVLLPRLRALRQARGLSQAELAKAAGVHAVTVSNVERGKFPASWETIERLAKALRLSKQDLMRAEE